MPEIIGRTHPDSLDDEEDLKSLIETILERHGQAREVLSTGELDGVVPDYEEDVEHFCRAYVRTSKLDPRWRDDELGVLRLLPLAVLAGEFPLSEVRAPDESPLDDP